MKLINFLAHGFQRSVITCYVYVVHTSHTSIVSKYTATACIRANLDVGNVFSHKHSLSVSLNQHDSFLLDPSHRGWPGWELPHTHSFIKRQPECTLSSQQVVLAVMTSKTLVALLAVVFAACISGGSIQDTSRNPAYEATESCEVY